MAHTKAKGTSKLGRDSESKRLGVKIFGGSKIKCGQIIIRQRGTVYMAGDGVKRGNDDTLFAVRNGIVHFKQIKHRNFTGNKKLKQVISVMGSAAKKTQVKNERPKENPKKKSEAEVMAEEHLNPQEFKEAEREATKRDIIRKEEPPKIPPRKDKKK